MADIRIHRAHALGLQRARSLSRAWIDDVQRKLGLECTVAEGEDGDTVTFERSGVRGTLAVAADHFEVEAELGLLLSGFRSSIEAEIEQRLDKLIAQA